MAQDEGFETLTGRWRTTSKRSASLSSLITAVFVGVFLITAATLAVYIAWQNTRSRTEEANLRARGTAAVLAQLYADAAQSHGYGFRNLAGVKVFLENWFGDGAADKDLAWAYIRNDRGEVVVGQLRAHLVPTPAGLDDAAVRDWFFTADPELGDGFIRRSVNLERDQDGQRVRYAEVKIGYSLRRIRSDFSRQLLLAGLVALLGGVLLAGGLLWFLRRLILSPLKKLAEAMDDVRRGLFDTRAPIRRRDEIGALADTFNYMVVGLAERAHLADAFQRYVSKQILDKIMTSGERLQLHGETREVTVLFSDIRGFTTMSEKLLPEQVVSGLNEYFTEMVDVVFRHDGFINKFVGDAMMAIWGAPVEQDQPELRAVRAAIEMVAALRALNNRRVSRGERPLEIGIGISTGHAVSGNIGHVERMEYTVIGDAVNIAQRIESQTKKVGHTVLVSERTYRAVAERVMAEELPTMVVKGKEEPLKLFAVKSLRTAEVSDPAFAPPSDEHTAPLVGFVAPAPVTAVEQVPAPPAPAPALVADHPLASFGPEERTLPGDGIPPGALEHVSPSELTAPSPVPVVTAELQPVRPTTPDEVTLQPQVEASGAEYLVPDASDNGFADPVTSKVEEAEFFRRMPKE